MLHQSPALPAYQHHPDFPTYTPTYPTEFTDFHGFSASFMDFTDFQISLRHLSGIVIFEFGWRVNLLIFILNR